jgi:flavin reductase (DIM6/NTAB) family NADH-FMN oxidoreductase RutF
VVVGVKKGSLAHQIIKETKAFALNMLDKNQQALAFTFFKALERDGQSIGGEAFRPGSTGVPVFENTPAYVECTLVDTVERGDHSIFVGEVVDAGINRSLDGRPDETILWLKDLGDNIFYGG